MITRIILAIALVSSVAVASEPGRCSLVSEQGQPQRLVCQPLVEGCKVRVTIKADGTIVNKTTCVYTTTR